MTQVKADVIADAYSQMRISGLTVSPSPESLELALTRLENMMAEFCASNVCTEYTFEDTPDPNSFTNVDRYAWQFMATNLAIRLVPDFNKTIPQALINLANASYGTVSGVSAKKILKQVQYPSRQPMGSGNTLRTNRWQRFYRKQSIAPSSCATNNMKGGEINDFTEHFDSYLDSGETISSFTITSDPDLTVSNSAISSSDITYRVEAATNPNESSSGFQQVTITITTDAGRVEVRRVNFQLEV